MISTICAQVVKGGDGKKSDVDGYFEQLKKAGAQMGDPEDLEQPKGLTAFSGRARKLGVRVLIRIIRIN